MEQVLSISAKPYGQMDQGQVTEYTMVNEKGMIVKIINYGAIITNIMVPDREGAIDDVVLGFDNLEDYLAPHPFFGAVVGRYGNRIGGAQFELDGITYTLAKNNGENHLHGGVKGFDKYLWQSDTIKEADRVGVHMIRTSPDMEEGYPGTLEVSLTYWLDNNNNLGIDYEANSDKPTICNLTNHSYFNLGGANAADVLSHEVMIKSETITAVDAGLIPTGDLLPVEGTPFDFRQPVAIGARIDDNHQQIGLGGGYDHNFVIRRETPSDLELIASVFDRNSGRYMEVLSKEPGVQFYSGNFLDGSLTGKNGKQYVKRSGLCLETQHFPDSPNKPSFPSVRLDPGEIYETSTVYRFSLK
ncbi:MAG: galactose mutarotase [Saprospiraceae bacterium]|nr:galactose mutarotase [Saprospiraceae bacterium]